LEHLVCGEREYDWEKLREGCRYEGFSEFDKTIRLFWEVFDALSVGKFLIFANFLYPNFQKSAKSSLNSSQEVSDAQLAV